jgi:hypothetical protein
MITLEELSKIQKEYVDVKITYFWKKIEPTETMYPVVVIEKVVIWFKSPNVELWKYIMTNLSDGFEITIRGTRNRTHDYLDDCYANVLDEINSQRAVLGLATVHR